MEKRRVLMVVGIGFAVVVIIISIAAAKRFGIGVAYRSDFIVVNPVDLSQIKSISKFRSCMGHNYSAYNVDGEKEINRTMKHYLTPIQELADSTGRLRIFAPFDGTIIDITDDTGPEKIARGMQVWLEPDSANGWIFIFFHINPLDVFQEGSVVQAGELIGYANVKNAANFDFTVKKMDIVRGPNVIDTPFSHMSPEVLAEYEQWGVTRQNIVISKQQRDIAPCQYGIGSGEYEQVLLK